MLLLHQLREGAALQVQGKRTTVLAEEDGFECEEGSKYGLHCCSTALHRAKQFWRIKRLHKSLLHYTDGRWTRTASPVVKKLENVLLRQKSEVHQQRRQGVGEQGSERMGNR